MKGDEVVEVKIPAGVAEAAVELEHAARADREARGVRRGDRAGPAPQRGGAAAQAHQDPQSDPQQNGSHQPRR